MEKEWKKLRERWDVVSLSLMRFVVLFKPFHRLINDKPMVLSDMYACLYEKWQWSGRSWVFADSKTWVKIWWIFFVTSTTPALSGDDASLSRVTRYGVAFSRAIYFMWGGVLRSVTLGNGIGISCWLLNGMGISCWLLCGTGISCLG